MQAIQEQYEIIELAGSGAYGNVFKAQCKKTGETVAIKHITNFKDSSYNMVKIIREISILNGLQSAFVPKVLNTILSEEMDDLFIVMEYQANDLSRVISGASISQDHVKTILYNLLCAMKQMCSANVIHRDLKPSNILINQDCQIKICDFGLSRSLPESATGSGSGNTKRLRNPIKRLKIADRQRERRMVTKKLQSDQAENPGPKKRSMSTHVSSRWYRAPEISLVQRYDNASDMWSLGCILFELLKSTVSTKSPILFQGEHCYPLSPKQNRDQNLLEKDQLYLNIQQLGGLDEHDIAHINDADILSYIEKLHYKSSDIDHDEYKNLLKNDEIPQQMKDILVSLLEFNPYLRPSADELLQNPYFDSIRNIRQEQIKTRKIRLQVDQDDSFDYETGKQSFSQEQLKKMLRVLTN